MHLDQNTLSIRLTEPVVPLRSTSERASTRDPDQTPPPAVVRGLLTLKLTKPTKVSSIELELHAKATTRYVQGAGPNRLDVSEQYKVHSASKVVFKAGPAPQGRRAISTRPRVQFLRERTRFSVQHGTRAFDVGSGYCHPPYPHAANRSASLDPVATRVRQRLSSDELAMGHPYRGDMLTDPAPPYDPRPADHHPFLNVDSPLRSQSVASSVRSSEPQRSPRSSLTPDFPYGSPSSAGFLMRDNSMSRASSVFEAQLDESETLNISPARRGSISHYGLSRIATGSSTRSSETSDRDHRGRSHSRFSFGRVVHVFGAVKDTVRSRSPRAGSRPPPDDQEERGRTLTKGTGKAPVSTYGVSLPLPRIGVTKPPVAEGANEQSGDGWVMFPEGAYTYPIFFTIPNSSPPTMSADHGSLIWKVSAEVKRPGAFMPNMTAQKEIIVVCAPKDDDAADTEVIDFQRQWEGQLQYHVQTVGSGVPVGGNLPLQLTIVPLAKVKVHSIFVYLDERTDYHTKAQSRVRSDPIRRATLLAIKHSNLDEWNSKPILPLLCDEPDAFRKSPLHRFLLPGESESDAAASYMGPGPWTIRHQLKVPDSCSVLRPTNQTKGSNIMVNHTLKLVLRVEKEEANTTGRRKMYDIVIHFPIQILSCRCTSEWTSLPPYELQSDDDSLEDTTTCPCRSRGTKARKVSRGADTLLPTMRHDASSTTAVTQSLDISCLPDSLAGRTRLHERLISGLVSETGEAPPSYERFDTVYERPVMTLDRN